ncbi:(p)ppGpp synthetase [Betaproteobacteria bacterium]|nr:(p)ppGpp synthetase [Betaproteobacteria bacterium]
MINDNYPGGSKSRVNYAGDAVRNNSATPEDMSVIESWRAAHRAVLNTFQAILRVRVRQSGKNIIVAQRHKRRNTIFNKLSRLPKMQLARMDDVAGCRLIFENIGELNVFRNSLLKARFQHKRRNDPEKYHYINHPKPTGYRGIHDVYEYDVNSITGKDLKGSYIEIQYRTKVQHAWATAVEIVGFITESRPKFETGDKRYREIMAYASEILARSHEDLRGPFPDISDSAILNEFKNLDSTLSLMKTLKGLKYARNDISDNRKNSILIFNPDGTVKVHSYRSATDALKALFKFENEKPNDDMVLVRAEKGEDVKMAFRNYFSDTEEFVSLMETALTDLERNNAV